MTDPVDTDALNTQGLRNHATDIRADTTEAEQDWLEVAESLDAAADEVDRLRAEADVVYRSAYRLGKQHSGAKVHKQRASELRAVIENAPHGWDCAQETYDGHDDSIACNCWKADAP